MDRNLNEGAWTYPSGSKQCHICASQPEPSISDAHHSGDSLSGVAGCADVSESSLGSSTAATSAIAESLASVYPAINQTLCELSQSDYSALQLKAKVKRRCKWCVSAIKPNRDKFSDADAVAVGKRCATVCSSSLRACRAWANRIGSDPISGLDALLGLTEELDAQTFNRPGPGSCGRDAHHQSAARHPE